MRPVFSSVLMIVLLAACGTSAMAAAPQKTPVIEPETLMVGRVEKVYVPEIGARFKARMDTGAETSSIDAEIIEIKGTTKKTVVFSMSDEDGQKKILEKDVERMVRIKKKEGGFLRRPVVRMDFCIGGQRINEEVNLSERKHFLYQILIGRNTMAAGNLIVNPQKTFLTNAVCKDKDKDKAGGTSPATLE